ncbi:unnamed protein product [Xylocopa violacea]
MALEQSMPIMFRLSFPSDLPIPMLTSILFNNEIICTGPPAVGPIVSTIVLVNELHLSGKGCKKKLTVISILPAISLNQPNNLDCGRGLPIAPVAGDSEVSPGQWPWVVAIFIVKREFVFQCTGTLVTNKHVISAAQCFYMDNMSLLVENFMVSVGRYDLRDWRQKGSVNSDVAEYRIHPDFSYTDISNDADLAVAILRDKVEYGPLIRPCCLWSWSADLNVLRGKYGTVVGWDLNELGEYNSKPKWITASIVSQEECLRSNGNYAALMSNRTFCAEHRKGSFTYKGENGSGLVIYEQETDRFYLRGVVSKTIAGAIPSDENEFTIFVDVARHLNWIYRQITQYCV